MSGTERYAINEWTVDPALNQISRGDQLILLEPRLVELLDFLSRHPNVTHSRDTLERAVWQGSSVSEGTINHAIAKVRKALDDDPKQPSFIQTIPKKGYRFLAERRLVSDDAPRAGQPSSYSRPALATAALVALAGAVGFLIWSAFPPAASDEFWTARPVTSYAGQEISLDTSRGGGRLLFKARPPGEASWQLNQLDLESGEVRRLLTNENEVVAAAYSPEAAFSPDGGRVALVSHAGNSCDVRIADLSGREPTTSVDSIPGCLPAYVEIAWANVGDRVYYTKSPTPPFPLAIYEHDLISGKTAMVSRPHADAAGDVAFAISPDGRRIASLRTQHWSRTELIVIDLLSREESTIRIFDYMTSNVAWSASGDELIVTDDPEGRTLKSIALADGSERTLSVREKSVGAFAFDPVTGKLFATETSYDANIFETDAGGQESEATRIVSSTRSDYSPQWSPDGEELAFLSERSGSPQIWVLDGQDRTERSLSAFGPDFRPVGFSWSPDGSDLVAFSMQGQLKILSRASGAVTSVELGSEVRAYFPFWDPSREHLYFTANIDGEREVWKLPLTGGISEPIKTTSAGAYAARISGDGRFLYYTKYYREGLWRYSLETGTEENVLPEIAEGARMQWHLVGSGVYYARSEQGRLVLHRTDLDDGREERLFAFPGQLMFSYSVHPVTGRLSYTHAENVSRDVVSFESKRSPGGIAARGRAASGALGT